MVVGTNIVVVTLSEEVCQKVGTKVDEIDSHVPVSVVVVLVVPSSVSVSVTIAVPCVGIDTVTSVGSTSTARGRGRGGCRCAGDRGYLVSTVRPLPVRSRSPPLSVNGGDDERRETHGVFAGVPPPATTVGDGIGTMGPGLFPPATGLAAIGVGEGPPTMGPAGGVVGVG